MIHRYRQQESKRERERNHQGVQNTGTATYVDRYKGRNTDASRWMWCDNPKSSSKREDGTDARGRARHRQRG